MSSACVVANSGFTDPAPYEDYETWSTLPMQVHGAQVRLRGGAAEAFEGGWRPHRWSC